MIRLLMIFRLSRPQCLMSKVKDLSLKCRIRTRRLKIEFQMKPHSTLKRSVKPMQRSTDRAETAYTEPLFLSPYIEKCQYYKAREMSKVPLFSMYKEDLRAHSGYITVKKNATQSHFFFLFTEVEGNSSEAPLLLWTQGGPGLSALFGFFLENGPVGFSVNGSSTPELFERENTLQKNMSVLYVDLPVGAGFSFTNETAAYPRRLEDIAEDVNQFLKQFLMVFSEYRGRKIFLAGESYGARYAVAIAENMLKYPHKLPLEPKGIIGGNGFLGPILDTADSSSFLYQTSMLTKEGYGVFAYQFEQMRQMLRQNETSTLSMLLQTIFTDLTKKNETMFQRLTMYDDHASPLHTQRPWTMLACFRFLSQNKLFKTVIHAGANTTFQYNNPHLLRIFAGDWLRDITEMIEEVISRIDAFFYTGQLDALFPSVNQREYYKKLNWTGALRYRSAERYPWKPSEDYYGFAGYIKKGVSFADAVVLGMGHYGAVDKPDEVYHLMTQFVSDSAKNRELFSPHRDEVTEGPLPQC
ncbi:hypothetical protein HPB50_021531 [Hyalomma asiaticum]|uniref:Uncharacterized protein n=1 Tax=Hyalomma asiaticum TaxID=266040 RepID=A0ACB7RKT8_HYAAI|nr:hypothetical protein HPB50_021531 [Hyalomma asiaticum]